MTFISEFSYPDISQRRIVLLNSLFSFIIQSFIYINAAIILYYYFFYQQVLHIVFITGIIGIFTGNLTGKLLFEKIKNFRLIYICTDILFIISCSFYIYGGFIIPGNHNLLLNLFFINQFYTILPLLAVSVFIGIKIRYFLKICCGDFIDNKIAITPFILFIITGMAFGIGLSILLYYYKELFLYSGLLLLPVLSTFLFINLSYNPTPIYAQEIKETSNIREEGRNNNRDDLLFIYLNFTYILIYIFLGFTGMIKYSGDFLHIKIYFILISLISLSIGIVFAKILKQAFWYIYVEMIYPVFFIASLLFLLLQKDKISFNSAVAFFIPLSVLLGFSLFQITRYITTLNNHKKRFNILNFSLFILPFPILISLNFIQFTYLWYFVLLYIVAILNIFIPGIYLLQSEVKGYKKILFFVFSLLFIPVIIIFHLYFKIPLNNKLFVSHATGFEKLEKINYNSNYINNEATIYIHEIRSFHADDISIRNMKRSIIPAMLYINDSNINQVLFIDGNWKFFKNPMFSIVKNSSFLDYFPERLSDYKTLPISGDQNPFFDHSDILQYLITKKTQFKMIVDIPNLFDQSLNEFRFSKEYFYILKNYLNPDGIFVQILSTNCRKYFFESSVLSHKESFKKTIGFFFPGYLVLISSNNDDTLTLGQDNINNLKILFNKETEIKNLFYNEFHFLSHLLFLKIDDIANTNKQKPDLFYFLHHPDKFDINKNIAGFSENNGNFLNLLEKSNTNFYFTNSMQNHVSINNFFISGIKKAELFELNKDYENESAQLIKLRMQSDYREDLRKYIWNILSYKEEYYYNLALNFEKEKKWEEARKLYKAILTINKNNFEANYRLGILSIVLQDLDSAFLYLQNAMQLKRDNPKVYYQMGVLLISRGKPRDALGYFEKTLEREGKSASLLYYIGLCYEEMNNLTTAINYYNQALILDQNDKNIISGIERIKEKNSILQNELKQDDENNQNSHLEAEGENMPLEVTETAKNVRIEEENSSKPKTEEKK